MATMRLEGAISDGPSKFDLMSSLFASDEASTRWVHLELEGYGRIQARFESLHRIADAETSGGDTWSFFAILQEDRYQRGSLPHTGINGVFSTRTRKGGYEFVGDARLAV